MRIYSKGGTVWEYNIRLMEAYIEEFGRAPKSKEIVCGVKLGSWWAQAKYQTRKGINTADRKAAVKYLAAMLGQEL